MFVVYPTNHLCEHLSSKYSALLSGFQNLSYNVAGELRMALQRDQPSLGVQALDLAC